MKDIFVEQFLILINLVWVSSPVHNKTDLGQIHYRKISLSNNIYTHTSLTVSLIIMSSCSWVGFSKNNLASVILQSKKKKKKSSNFWNVCRIFSLCWSKQKCCKVAETLSEICLSGQPCKLGSPLFECIKLQWLSYTKNSLASIIL